MKLKIINPRNNARNNKKKGSSQHSRPVNSVSIKRLKYMTHIITNFGTRH